MDPDTLSVIDENISAPETRIVYTDSKLPQRDSRSDRSSGKPDWDYTIAKHKTFDDFDVQNKLQHTAIVLPYYKQQFQFNHGVKPRSSHSRATSATFSKKLYSSDDLSNKPYTYEQMLIALQV